MMKIHLGSASTAGLQWEPPLHKLIEDASRLVTGRWGLTAAYFDKHTAVIRDDRLAGIKNPNLYIENHAGILTYANSTYGDAPDKFRVWSTGITNDRYKENNRKRKSFSTKSARQALNLFMRYVLPMTWRQIFQAAWKGGNDAHSEWQQEARKAYVDAMSQAVVDGASGVPNAIMEALLQEQAMRGDFRADLLRRITTPALRDAFQERQRREHSAGMTYALFIDPASDMSVMHMTNPPSDSYIEEPLDRRPLFMQEQVAMLKMMPVGNHMPGVGFRAGDHIYWLYDPALLPKD